MAEWLQRLGVSEYAERFAENDVDQSDLRDLTDQDLRELGVSLGHRRRILRAIAACESDSIQKRSGPRWPTAKFCPECGQPIAASQTVAAREASMSSELAVKSYATAPARIGAPVTYTPRHLAEKILTSRSAIEGERKNVTALFADLKGSMELLADRDPEEARGILDPVLELMMDAIHYYEGTVSLVMGDGIVAIFGAPVAHEDHAVRACYAAVRMQESVQRHAEEVHRTQGIPIQIRVGLNSGEVVVRSVGSDLHMDYTAIGQTMHLAARMEQMAIPGTILAASGTMQLAEGYVVTKSLGPRPVKGLCDPVQVYEVLRATAVRSRLRAAAARGLTTFVGRTSELDLIALALQRAADGHGQTVALVGEAGVGKSRLIWEFTHSPRTQGCLIVESSSAPFGKSAAYSPLIDLIKAYFGVGAHEDARTVREKVAGKLFALDRALEPFLPAFLSMLDAPCEDLGWDKLDPPQRRQRTLDGIRRLLLLESRKQPVIVLFEDLHWIDVETQDFLNGLVECLPTARILLLVTYRPEYQHAWARKTYYREIRVDPLSAGDSDTILERLLGKAEALKPLKRLLFDRTEGNPFFIEECVRTLTELKFLDGERGAYTLLKPAESLQIPASAQAILTARIDRLAPEVKRALQAAAVIGREVPFALLAAIIEDTEHELRDSLSKLQAAELLYETTVFPDLEYTFRHSLTQEVAYNSLVHQRRRALHSAIVESIERLYPDRLNERVERLAHHAFRGELWDKVLRYARQAGRKALERSANCEAITFFEQALSAAQRLPNNREREEQEIDLRFDLRLGLMPLGEFGRTLELLNEAKGLATELNDQRRLGWIAAYMTNVFWELGEQDRAVESGRHALVIARSLEDGALLNKVNRYLGRSHYAIGDYRQAIDIFAQVVGPPEHNSKQPAADILSAVLARHFLMLCLAEVGAFDQAAAHGEAALRIAQSLDRPFQLSSTWLTMGRVLLRKGDFDRAVPLLERGLSGCITANIPVLYPFCASPLGAAYARLGRLSEALPLLEQSLERAVGMRQMVNHSLYCYWLSQALLLAQRVDDARNLAGRALECSMAYKERGNQAWILRLLGDIYTKTGARVQAETYYRQSLRLAEEMEMRPLAARCHLSLGEYFLQQDRELEARDSLLTAQRLAREMEMTFWAHQAESLSQGIRARSS